MNGTRAWYFTGLVFLYLSSLAGIYLFSGDSRLVALGMTVEFGVTGMAMLLGGYPS